MFSSAELAMMPLQSLLQPLPSVAIVEGVETDAGRSYYIATLLLRLTARDASTVAARACCQSSLSSKQTLIPHAIGQCIVWFSSAQSRVMPLQSLLQPTAIRRRHRNRCGLLEPSGQCIVCSPPVELPMMLLQ